MANFETGIQTEAFQPQAVSPITANPNADLVNLGGLAAQGAQELYHHNVVADFNETIAETASEIDAIDSNFKSLAEAKQYGRRVEEIQSRALAARNRAIAANPQLEREIDSSFSNYFGSSSSGTGIKGPSNPVLEGIEKAEAKIAEYAALNGYNNLNQAAKELQFKEQAAQLALEVQNQKNQETLDLTLLAPAFEANLMAQVSDLNNQFYQMTQGTTRLDATQIGDLEQRTDLWVDQRLKELHQMMVDPKTGRLLVSYEKYEQMQTDIRNSGNSFKEKINNFTRAKFMQDVNTQNDAERRFLANQYFPQLMILDQAAPGSGSKIIELATTGSAKAIELMRATMPESASAIEEVQNISGKSLKGLGKLVGSDTDRMMSLPEMTATNIIMSQDPLITKQIIEQVTSDNVAEGEVDLLKQVVAKNPAGVMAQVNKPGFTQGYTNPVGLQSVVGGTLQAFHSEYMQLNGEFPSDLTVVVRDTQQLNPYPINITRTAQKKVFLEGSGQIPATLNIWANDMYRLIQNHPEAVPEEWRSQPPEVILGSLINSGITDITKLPAPIQDDRPSLATANIGQVPATAALALQDLPAQREAVGGQPMFRDFDALTEGLLEERETSRRARSEAREQRRDVPRDPSTPPSDRMAQPGSLDDVISGDRQVELWDETPQKVAELKAQGITLEEAIRRVRQFGFANEGELIQQLSAGWVE